MSSSWGLLLVNLGTPDSTSVRDVRRYLREFLSDPRVIDIPGPARWLLLNLVILPFRPRRSAEAYEKIWTPRGSPLLLHAEALAEKVRARLEGAVQVEVGMRYGRPSIASALDRFHAAAVERIVVFPLFPQYSSAAYGSAVQEVHDRAGERWEAPRLHVVPPFFDEPAYLGAIAAIARPILDEMAPDRVLLSFHGVPERHVQKSDASGGRHCLVRDDCCDALCAANRNCYRAQCFATARGLVRTLDLAEGTFDVSFQSRLGRTPWIRPYTDERLRELAASGVRRVAVLSPAFVADCLETLEELALRNRDDFVAAGGEELRLVPALNAHDAWVDAVVELARRPLTHVAPAYNPLLEEGATEA